MQRLKIREPKFNLNLLSLISILSTLLSVSTILFASYICCHSHHSPTAPSSNHHHHHCSNHTSRRLVEAERLVPGSQELAAADPSVHAALGGRSALAVRRGLEAEEVIIFVGFSFIFGVFFFFLRFFLGGGWFGVLPFDVFVWLPRKKCVNIFV
jgi:hypothetical protein